jgi:Cdc6-like AAA superfamily ATPase
MLCLLTLLARAIASVGAALPCYHLPLLRNTRFVGRETKLDELKNLLFRQKIRSVALLGLGGVGKTQVALELTWWAKENHPEYSILWVPALSEATFEQAYAEIARKLAVRKAADDEDVKESVRRHLSSPSAGPWLLIVDNADNVEVVSGSSICTDPAGGRSRTSANLCADCESEI